MAKAARFAVGARQFFDLVPLRAQNFLNDHLRHPLSRANDHRLCTQVDHHELNLTAIVGVNRARAVD
jgi:hypothetical protein